MSAMSRRRFLQATSVAMGVVLDSLRFITAKATSPMTATTASYRPAWYDVAISPSAAPLASISLTLAIRSMTL